MPRPLPLPRVLLRRCSSAADPKTIINIPKSNIYALGAGSRSSPVLNDVQWVVKEGEAWAVVDSGSGGKDILFRTLQGSLRLSPSPPAPGGIFPFLTLPNPTLDPLTKLGIVSFTHRRRAGGDFYDYTARYGAVRDEDRVTLRQSMFPQYVRERKPSPFAEEDRVLGIRKEEDGEVDVPEEELKVFEELVGKMELRELLDLPLVALNNGQMRRVRIVKAILRKPELLLLDEPLTGLDTHARPLLLTLLHQLHESRAPRIILGLRTQDVIPEWITNVVVVRGGGVISGEKGEVLEEVRKRERDGKEHTVFVASGDRFVGERAGEKKGGEVLVKMEGVSVKYGPRVVLKDINWTIRQGERWHLQGANGSGKTTLLSLLTGEHPQSWIQKGLWLPSIPRTPSSLSSTPEPSTPSPTSPAQQTYPLLPRRSIPTPHLSRLISHLSPELYDAFPRRHPGMSVWEAVATGFDGGFVSKGPDGLGDLWEVEERERERVWDERRTRVWRVLDALAPPSSPAPTNERETARQRAAAFSKLRLSSLPTAHQRLTLLARALVAHAPIVILDEVWSGMDEESVERVRGYLRGGAFRRNQAVVVVTHWVGEVPWAEGEVRRFELGGGVGVV
ncbi:P-loop containing nucleoside triphosphate hydrolase protein [Cyathus striatus]|nr:P-loop containing nucleoside triphosphate hydrolase protein [Cyathus striatus]